MHSTKITLRTQLKTATNPQHKVLDTCNIAQAMLKGQITLERYQAYLKLMYQVHNQIETQLLKQHALFTKQGLDISSLFRLAMLEQDMLAIGLSDVDVSKTAKDTSLELLQNLKQEPHLVGTFYVIAGSIMGGQILARKLQYLNQGFQQSVTTYLQGFGKNNMAMWQSYCEFLENYSKQFPQNDELVIQGAQQTFKAIADVMVEL